MQIIGGRDPKHDAKGDEVQTVVDPRQNGEDVVTCWWRSEL